MRKRYLWVVEADFGRGWGRFYSERDWTRREATALAREYREYWADYKAATFAQFRVVRYSAEDK